MLFGEIVPDDVMSSDSTGVIRGAMGLAFLEGAWWPVERVADPDEHHWRQSIQSGPGRDERLAGDVRDSSGRRHVNLHDYLALLRPVDRSRKKDWPHPGPSAALETFTSVRGTNMELLAYEDHWAKNSGIALKSSLRTEHRNIFKALALFQGYDQVDLPATAGGEFLCRRVIQIQRAVRVNPRAPSFIGLHKMTEHSLDETGGVNTREFTQFFAAGAEAEARVLKQNRLFRNELEVAPTPLDEWDEDGPRVTAKQRKARAKAKAVASAPAR